MTALRHLGTAAAVAALALAAPLASPVSAQYFGQNKVQYRSFDFQVLKTEHFDLYYYPEEEAAARDVARMAERWYARLSRLLRHQLSGRQPLVIYASHPHFEQTNVVEGALGEGTGGVTESLKRRIVMPVGGGPAETDHVLGHELVHAFQYDILGANLAMPLWFIEGMAEYLSVGAVDSQTALWMRDAALNEKLPAVKDLSRPEYFPYRFGHAFWAYVGGRFGDRAIADILDAAAGPRGGGGARRGADPIAVIEAVVGMDDAELSQAWHAAILETMLRPLRDRATQAGRLVIEPEDEQEINLGPVLSPDGSRLAFLSSRDRLSIDLFVADAGSGRITRKLISTAADPHFDSLQFISSAGTWDPAGRQFAIAAIREGRPALAIVDATTGDRLREIPLPGIDEVFHPAWSPDGRLIAFSGLAGGISNLWVLGLESGELRKLTDDAFADLQPAWSPDGRRLVFSTDRYSTRLDTLDYGEYELAFIDVETRQTTRRPVFEGARHIAPQWARDGALYFIANPDGVPDVYRVAGPEGSPTRVTRLITGATGITSTSPALTLAADGSRLAVVVYRDSTYQIHAVEGDALRGRPIESEAAATMLAARLVPTTRPDAEATSLLRSPAFGLPPATRTDAVEDYNPRLSLDYIGQEFGITTNNGVGGYVGGGIALSFSDMLGNHNLTSLLQLNGTFDDLGGQIAYLNRSRRWNWGGLVAQIPYVTGGIFAGIDSVGGQPVIVEQQLRDRQVDRRVMGIAAYPLSRARRLELGASLRRLTFDRRIETRGFDINTGDLLFEESAKTSLGDPLTLGEFTAAFVQDTAIFGATGPVLGQRSRLDVSPAFGDLRFTSVIADARHYVMPFRPVTIASRLLHVGRYGPDAESLRLSPLFLGYPSLVRGYDLGSFEADECVITDRGTCSTVDQFVGSRLLIAGVEARAPLVGLFTGRLDYGPIPADLVGFFDAGVAWDRGSRPNGLGDGDRPWARSVGAGIRVNAFGYVILELDAVRALDRPRDGWRFVFALRPGY